MPAEAAGGLLGSRPQGPASGADLRGRPQGPASGADVDAGTDPFAAIGAHQVAGLAVDRLDEVEGLVTPDGQRGGEGVSQGE